MTLAYNPVLEAQPDPVPLHLHRLTVEQYHRMIGAGILHSGDPVELLEGWLVEKASRSPAHSVCTGLIRRELEGCLPVGWYVNSKEPITTLDSEPEPDLAVIMGNPRDYLTHHPFPEQLGLVVEVSDSSLKHDQTLKKRLYARANVPVYWIANLLEMQIEVYSEAQATLESPDYATVQIYRAGEQIPFVLEGQTHLLRVSELLP